jgi:N utilization substance protein A
MASQISQAIRQVCEEKNLTFESVLETVEAALAAAFRKDFGNKNQNIKVQFDPEAYDGATAGIRVFDVKTVVPDMELPDDYFEKFEAANAVKKFEARPPSKKKEAMRWARKSSPSTKRP